MDRRSKHIDKYPLKSLASDELLKALCLFLRDMVGRHPDKIIGDHDFKLIGGQVTAALEGINEYREEKYRSVVTGAPEGRHNQNGLPEIKCRHVMTMVCNFLTSNYLPQKLWYLDLKMDMHVSNYMPILLDNGQWTTLHEQKYGTNPYWCNLVPMLSLGYICRNRDGNKQPATSDSQSIMGICDDNDTKSNELLFYLPTSKNMVGSAYYHLNPVVPFGHVFVYSYDGGIVFNLYNTSTIATCPPSYEKEELIYFKTKKNTRISEGGSISQLLGQR